MVLRHLHQWDVLPAAARQGHHAKRGPGAGPGAAGRDPQAKIYGVLALRHEYFSENDCDWERVD
jgi:hypothetical protein